MPVKHTETAFSYAAAASGKNSPVAGTKGTMPTENVLKTNPNTDTTVFNPSNGVVAGKLDAVSVTTANEILVAPKKDLSTPSPNGISMQTPFEPPLSVNGTIPEPKDDTKTEPKIQSSDNASSEKLPETENVNGGTKTPDVPKKDLPLAPPPAVNVWKLRAEGFTAKAKVQPLPTTSTGGLKPAVSSKPLEKQGDLKQVERRKSGYRQETGNWEGTSERGASRDNVPYERKDNGREGRDRKKSIEAGRVNGFTNKEDGTPRHGKPGRHTVRTQNSQEKEPASELPPPLADTTLWPTPETAHDEERKERKEKEEKDKDKPIVTRSAGPTKFVPAPFTPTIVHSQPLPTKGGRGGRGGRGGSRGGSTGEPRAERGERFEKPNSGTVTGNPDPEQRGRNGSRGTGYLGRGAHQGRGGRRTGSTGSNTTREQRRGASLESSSDIRLEGGQSAHPGAGVEEGLQGNAQGTVVPSKADSSSGRGNAQAESFAGQSVAKQSERHERNHGNSHYSPAAAQAPHSHGRSDSLNPSPESATFYPQNGRSERGMGGRGGFRGRGNHYGSQYSHGTHTNPLTHSSAQQFQQPHHTQHPPFATQSQSYRANRGNGRGHAGPGRTFPPFQSPMPYSGHQFSVPQYPYFEYMGLPQSEEQQTPADFYAELLATLTKQLEYYFSIDNLCKDLFLRKHMDSEGFVKFQLIASFGRIRHLTAGFNSNMDILRDACLASPHIELVSGADGMKLRKATGWEAFVLKPEERDPSAKETKETNNGDSNSQHGQNSEQQTNGHVSPTSSEMSPAAPAFEPQLRQKTSLNSIAPEFVPSVPFTPVVSSLHYGTNGDTGYKVNGIEAQYTSSSHLSANASVFSPTIANGSLYEDEFPDSKFDDLIIVYKRSLLETSTEASSLKTNGPIEQTPYLNGDSSSYEDGAESPLSSPLIGPSNKYQSRLSHHGVSWIIGWQLDTVNVPFKEVHEGYTALRTTALQRRSEGFPLSPKMIILYRFWKHFLRNHFNTKMYDEFRSCATQDATTTSGKSLGFLFEFFENIHTTGMPTEALTHDFVTLVEKSLKEGTDSGLAKLGNIVFNLQMSPLIKARLDNLMTGDLRARLETIATA